jgi:hypothetical protein
MKHLLGGSSVEDKNENLPHQTSCRSQEAQDTAKGATSDDNAISPDHPYVQCHIDGIKHSDENTLNEKSEKGDESETDYT